MKLADFVRLKKLMNMTLSGADRERLTAIDKANEIVRNAETTWDRILDRVIKVDVEIESVEAATGRREEEPAVEAARREAFRKKVDDAFEVVFASDPRGDFADFVSSLKEQWDAKGRLSPAQLSALFKSADRAEGRR